MFIEQIKTKLTKMKLIKKVWQSGGTVVVTISKQDIKMFEMITGQKIKNGCFIDIDINKVMTPIKDTQEEDNNFKISK